MYKYNFYSVEIIHMLGWKFISLGFCKAAHALNPLITYRQFPFKILVLMKLFSLILAPRSLHLAKRPLRQIFWDFTEEEKEVLHIFHELLFSFL